MRAGTCSALLLLAVTAASATAQLDSGSYWEQAGLRAHGGMRVLSGATLRGSHGQLASAAVVGSSALTLSDLTLGMHAGALHDRHGVTSAGVTLSALIRAGGNQLELKAGAAAAPDEHRGASVTSLGATIARSGLSLSVRSNILPPLAGRMGDSVIVDRDTTYRIGYIEAGRPRRLYTDTEMAYRRGYSHVVFDAIVGYRIGSDPSPPFWARLAATWRVTSAFALGGSYGREPDTPWLQSKAGNTGTVFLRIDPPLRTARARPLRNTPPVQPLHIATNGVTTFTISAPAAKSVEIAGTFSDWSALALERGANGTWSAAVPLGRGVYQIALRIDGGRWRAPPGVATVPDEFGGETGVFEVR